jgi:hypothetical protein
MWKVGYMQYDQCVFNQLKQDDSTEYAVSLYP